MCPVLPLPSAAARPAISLGVSYEGRDPALMAQMLAHVDYVEVTPETIAEVDGDTIVLSREVLAELKEISQQVPIIVHGVSLSIGSHDGWAPTYLHLLDDLMEQVDVAWHSEHLGYTKVDGQHLGIMLAMPRTEQALDLVCARTEAIQQRYGIPFLLENIVHVIPDCPGAYSDAGFLNALTARTGCGLILDIYNLECDEHNHGLNIAAFMAELNGEAVRELHVACGVMHNGFMLDVHSRLTRPRTADLAYDAIHNVATSAQVVVYEFMPEAVPGLGHAAIGHELAQLRARFQG
ncbi:DUF692 family multinuclear iron-containing protein [Massilia sp. CF038]|uniref:DUF692 domain-containing protein n=1 Tax=Massilia sp. CF038 TaxID=1881045 RepID=UPI00091D15B9|nr:DUF692 family multinuclear iron-containing protein [Massilia sp. CF038]SHG99974.1 hypothetical protein SAMN05428948_2257 [Massilia sp. CF038]